MTSSKQTSEERPTVQVDRSNPRRRLAVPDRGSRACSRTPEMIHAIGRAPEGDRGSSATCRLIFKASFDKANRSSQRRVGARSRNLESGLELLGTSVAHALEPAGPDRRSPAGAVCPRGRGRRRAPDSRPSCAARRDLLEAAAETGRAVNIKKGTVPGPLGHGNTPLGKCRVHAATENLMVTERGTSSFGYGRLVVDMNSASHTSRRSRDTPSSSTPRTRSRSPAALGTDARGETADRVPALARAAVATGARWTDCSSRSTPIRTTPLPTAPTWCVLDDFP